MSDARRLMGIVVTGELVAKVILPGTRNIFTQSNLPPLARFFTAYFDYSRNAFVCVFEDDSFGMVCEGAVIPLIDDAKVSVSSVPIGETMVSISADAGPAISQLQALEEKLKRRSERWEKRRDEVDAEDVDNPYSDLPSVPPDM